MKANETATEQEFVTKCEQFARAMQKLDIEDMDTGDDIETLTACQEFFKVSAPELIRLARIALSMTAQ